MQKYSSNIQNLHHQESKSEFVAPFEKTQSLGLKEKRKSEEEKAGNDEAK